MRNRALMEMALDPVPYVHHVIREWNLVELEYRFACICGHRSEWVHLSEPWWEFPDHPDGVVTVSRTDLRPYPHPSQVHA